MRAKAVIDEIDVWSQWDLTFGPDSNDLRAFFAPRPALLKEILYLLITTPARNEPPKIWWKRWNDVRPTIPENILRAFLLHLTTRAEWYLRLASEDELTKLKQAEEYQREGRMPTSGNSIHLAGNIAWTSYLEMTSWYRHNGVWYRRLSQLDIHKTLRIAKGACYALVDFDTPQVREQLTRVLRRGLTAGAWTLARFGDDDAILRLATMLKRTRQNRILAAASSSLREISARHHTSIEELVEQTTLRNAFKDGREYTWECADGYSVTISLTRSGAVRRAIKQPDGSIRRGKPERGTSPTQVWNEVMAQCRLLTNALRRQKLRLEEALTSGRQWSYALWQEHFAANLLIYPLVRKLVWEIIPANQPQPGLFALPGEDGTWRDADGTSIEIDPDWTLRLAHPVSMGARLHSEWQRRLQRLRINQPFKQMRREIFVLTLAEEEARTFSPRFANYCVQAETLHNFMANQPLLDSTSSGWQVRYCGYDNCIVTRKFPAYNIQAAFWSTFSQAFDWNTRIVYPLAFYPLDHVFPDSQRPHWGSEPAQLPLSEISPVAFSEAIHDIALRLVTASVGRVSQQQLAERSSEPPVDRSVMHTQNSQRRVHHDQATLLKLLEELDLTNRVFLENQSARVIGNNHRYRISLQNGTVYLERSNRHLCIVTRSGSAHARLPLPFVETSSIINEVISKILLLVHDEQITDNVILRQLVND